VRASRDLARAFAGGAGGQQGVDGSWLFATAEGTANGGGNPSRADADQGHAVGPLAWHKAVGYQLDKGGDKQGTDALRIIFGLPPFGKAYYEGIFRRAQRAKGEWGALPNYSHGCRPGMSREAALTVTMCTTWKLRKSGISHLKSFHDMTNAFLCTPTETLDSYAKSTHRTILMQRC